MSVRKFVAVLAAWVLVCAWVLEPALISPFFDGLSTLDLASADMLINASDAPQTAAISEAAQPVISMDHLRALCLLYFGLPAAAYLLSQAEF
ncbi:MAG: hypothetical protein QE278_09260 [Limnobacter sp.]|nr:hypothetical protein [Limnobacter sp.]